MSHMIQAINKYIKISNNFYNKTYWMYKNNPNK